MPVQKQAPLPKQVDAPTPAPPPVLVQGEAEEATVKRVKSKRKQVQQASKGTSSLKIPLNVSDSVKSSTGLNIPTS